MEPADGEAIRAHLRTVIARAAAPASSQLLDLRELEAPAPLEQALLRAARLGRGEHFLAWTPRVPRMLLPRLEERGLDYVVEVASDCTALVYIERR